MSFRVKCNKCLKEHTEDIEGDYDIGFCPFCIQMTHYTVYGKRTKEEK